MIPIPVGLIDSANSPTPVIDIFMWSAGDNNWPRDGGGVSQSDSLTLNSSQIYEISLTSGISGYTKLKNQTTNTEIATTNGWATHTINGTIVSNNQDSPKIEFYPSATIVGSISGSATEKVRLTNDFEVNSGGSGAGSSCYEGSLSLGVYSGTTGSPRGSFVSGLGGDGVDNPYASIFGPTSVCAGGVGSFYGSGFNNTTRRVAAITDLGGATDASCFRAISGYNFTSTQSYTGSGATVVDNAQVGTNAGAGGAIIKSNVPLQVVNAQAATSAGYYYYFFTQSEQFQVA